MLSKHCKNAVETPQEHHRNTTKMLLKHRKNAIKSLQEHCTKIPSLHRKNNIELPQNATTKSPRMPYNNKNWEKHQKDSQKHYNRSENILAYCIEKKEKCKKKIYLS
ncbi:hypothetical protein F8M41_017181 [Gigaspora margarita]|uniref:Uncharacterized protein n=1 Tax=Gigaspora margarita TaxID=4874 RepID=A0A8H3ZYN1_GIGMA|nr:hypothetical protein F8M41_017181 [Gigaspora margarita]